MRLQVSVPLGGDRRLNSYISRRGERARAGTALSERVNEYVNYEVGVERDMNAREQSIRSQVDLMPRYTQVSLGGTRDALGIWSRRRCMSSRTCSCSHRVILRAGLGVHCSLSLHLAHVDGQ